MILQMRHIGRGGAGLCCKGVRLWCEQHRIDYLSFARNGIPLEQLAHIKCPLLDRVIEAARKEQADGRR